MDNVYIGIDIGSTAIKLTAVDKQLHTLYESQYTYAYLTPHKGWTEIDPDTWVTIVLEELEKLLPHIPSQAISGIGITGQMHTTVFVDEHGFSVRPAIMWNDTRTKEMIPDIKRRLRLNADTAHIATIASTGSPLANLLWMQEQESENYAKIAKFLIAKDYVILKLTGAYSTDYCDSSTSSLYDLNEDTWSATVQTEFGFKKEMFPPINHSSKIVGTLTKEMQNKLGIGKAIPVVAGTGDNVASALASGSFVNDQPLVSLGTSGVLVIPNSHHQLKETGKNVVARINATDNTIITQGTVQAGGKINSWWMETILQTKEFAKEQEKIADHLLGNNEVIFFPHLNGEKTLFANPNLRGAFVGLSLETTREELYLAVLEGVAFGIRRLFDLMKNTSEPDFITIVGGGSKSGLWVKLFANILQFPIKKVRTSQEAVHGAAILAIIGVEGVFAFDQKETQMIQPDPYLVEKYEEKYKRYLKLTQAMLEYTEAVN
nr:FGGY family carbohydrate kinase [uncultured Trichococcus sp.]